MKPEMIGNDIFLFKNIVSEEDCQYIRETIEKYPAWEEAKTFGNLENYRKTKVDYLVNRYGTNSELYRAHSIIGYNFKVAFENLMKEYKKNENESYLFYTGDEGVQVLKYEPGEFYHEHIDHGPNIKRVHSSLIFLNSEYEGGETEFRRQNLKFKGDTGDIIFFPSAFTHPHRACEVKNGTKYAAVIWSY